MGEQWCQGQGGSLKKKGEAWGGKREALGFFLHGEVCVVFEKGEPQQAGGRVRAPEPGESAPCTLLVSSGQAPACYCLKPHSPVPMEQMGGRGSRRILLG